MGEHVTDQDSRTFTRHPAYDAGGITPGTATGAAPGAAPEAAPEAGHPSGWPTPSGAEATGGAGRGGLLGGIGALLAVLSVGLTYVVLRWAEDAGTWFVVLQLLALAVLAGLALLAGRRGGLAAFVAIAVLLPFTTLVAAGAALSDRVEEEFDGWFSSGGGFFSDDQDSDASSSSGDGSERASKKPVALGDEVTSGNFAVAVNDFECTDVLPEAAENPDYFSSEDAAQYLDAKAPRGKQFCVVSSSWQNTSKEPDSVDSWDVFGKLVTADGTMFAPATDDTSYSYRLTEQAGHDNGTLNPGDGAELRTVFTVKAGLEFTEAVIESFGAETSTVWFKLR